MCQNLPARPVLQVSASSSSSTAPCPSIAPDTRENRFSRQSISQPWISSTRGGTTWTEDFKCREVKTRFCRKRWMQTGSSGTHIGWKSGQTTFISLWDRMEGAWLWTQGAGRAILIRILGSVSRNERIRTWISFGSYPWAANNGKRRLNLFKKDVNYRILRGTLKR